MRSYYLFTLLLGLLVVQKSLAQSFQNHAEIRNKKGTPVLFINGQEVPPFAYLSYLGKPEYYREMKDAGIEIFCVPAYLGDQGINSTSGIKPFRPSFWKGINQYDFSVVQKEFEDLVQVKRDAKVLIRVHLDPPIWWEKQNPDELCRLPSGESYRVSFSSQKWRADAGQALIALLDWLRKSEYNKNLIGIHVAGGFTEEWFFHYSAHFHDLSPARKRHYQSWLRQKYNNDLPTLQKAWSDPNARFENAEPIDISGKKPGNAIRMKRVNPQLDDTFEFHGQIMSDNIAYFAALVKNESQRRLLTGAFYGYHLFVHDPRRGHGNLAQLLQCKDLDYLSSPNDYRREVGVDWLPMAAIRSVQHHGKLWLAENDTRTTLTTLLREKAPHVVPEKGDWYDKGVWLGPNDLFTSRELLWKNAARMLAYGYGGWWFDMWGGWFSDPEMLEIFNTSQQLYRESIGQTQNAVYHPEVAVVVDEKLQFADDTYGRITGSILANRYPLGQAGTSFDIYLREDLPTLLEKNYKVVWLLGIFDLTQGEKNTFERLKNQTPYTLVTQQDGTQLYSFAQPLQHHPDRVRWSSAQLREIYKMAKVHVFSDQDDIVYAGNGWLSIHLSKSGSRVIELPSHWTLRNVKTKNIEPFTTNRLNIEGAKGETFLYKVQ